MIEYLENLNYSIFKICLGKKKTQKANLPGTFKKEHITHFTVPFLQLCKETINTENRYNHSAMEKHVISFLNIHLPKLKKYIDFGYRSLLRRYFLQDKAQINETILTS